MLRNRLMSKWRPRAEFLESRVTPAVAYALSNNALLAFDTTNPAAALPPVTVTNLGMGENLVGIDFRPQNGLLYGLTSNGAGAVRLYTIATQTGKATPLTAAPVQFDDGANPVPIAGTNFGVDFNPTVDKLRVVTDGGFNFRLNPNTGKLIDGDNGMAAGSVAGVNPDKAINGASTTVDGTAYTNDAPNVTVTTQYTIDSASDKLFIQAPPNSGTQTNPLAITLGGAPLDFTAVNGFDIPAGVNVTTSDSPATGQSFAALTVAGVTSLYGIELSTGVATKIGAVGTGTAPVQGFAVQSDVGGTPSIALGADGLSVLRFTSNAPDSVTTVTLTGVAAGEKLIGLDLRPATGQFYALGVDPVKDTATLYIVDPQGKAGTSGVTTVGTAGSITFVDAAGKTVDLPDPATAGYGVDFNPAKDKLRVVTSTGLNFRVNPGDGTPVDGDLGGAAGSVAGINTDGPINGGTTAVDATAYTNSFGGTAVTTQYTLDSASDKLFIQAPPNSGTQAFQKAITLGGAPLDFTAVNGFDIPASVTVATNDAPVTAGIGFAALTVGGTTGLYRIDLVTGAATKLGMIGAGMTGVTGLVVGDTPAGSIAFGAATFSAAEAGKVTVTLTRTGGTSGSVTVPLTAPASSDFAGLPPSVTFADGQTTATFDLTVTDDAFFEGLEAFPLTIGTPTGGAVLAAPAVASLVVADNEAAPNARVAYALSGNALVPFDTAAPANAGPAVPVTGLAMGETLVGADFRPQNGLMYGLGYDGTAGTVTLYAISQRTGKATPVGVTGQFVDGMGKNVRVGVDANTKFGIDFNPTVDRLRIVNNAGQNFRINPNTGAFIDGDLGGAAGSVAGLNMDAAINGGTTAVDGTAYTNNAPNAAVTTQYTLDSASDKLFIQAPPNSGKQVNPLPVTLGGAPLDFTAVGGFDIPFGVNVAAKDTPVMAGVGFAALTVGGVSGLYAIELSTGAATLVGPVGAGTAPVQGFAIESDLGGIPSIGLTADAKSLVRFNTQEPGTAKTVAVAGVAMGETLVGADLRPATGQFYALGVNPVADTATLYVVDPQLGTATPVGTPGQVAFVDAAGKTVDLPDPATAGYGFDFNPAKDKVRVVTSTGLNFRVNPGDGKPVDGDNGGAAGSVAGINTDGPISGGTTSVDATAYTNSFGGTTLTTQYTLDSATDKLFIQAPPNSGVQTNPVAITLGGAPLDFTAVNGFDIPAGVTAAANDAAVTTGFGFAALTVGGTTSVYRIDLVTGAATNVGATTAGSGLTLADAPAGSISFGAATFTAAEAGKVTVTLTRTGGSTGAVAVNLTGAGSDLSGVPAAVTFADGQTSLSFDVTVNDDALFEGLEAVPLTLSGPTNGAVVGATAKAVVAVTDNETPPTSNVAYVLSGNALVPFDTANPAAAGTPIPVTLQGGMPLPDALVGIDFRPQNGLLYGLGYNGAAGTVQLYAISQRTGEATPVGMTGQFVDAAGMPVRIGADANTPFGFDFNPSVDRIRVVNDLGQNFRLDPNTGKFLDGDLGGAAGSVAGLNMDGAINGAGTKLDAVGYAGNAPNTLAVTQFVIDSSTDTLFNQNPPNSGKLTQPLPITLGGKALDFSAASGFDVPFGLNPAASGQPVTGKAFAVLTVGGVAGLYAIELSTGEATFVGTVGAGTLPVQGFALQDDFGGGSQTIALTADGAKLLRFNSREPGAVTTLTIGGITAGETLVGFDTRASTGQLYALGVDAAKDTATLYILDPQGKAGATTLTVVGTASSITFDDGTGKAVDLPDPATTGYGVDFNPAVDKFRVVTASGLNFRVNADTGAPIDGDKGGMAMSVPGVNIDGGINVGGAAATVDGTAYTNSFDGTKVTTQYTIDSATDKLFIQSPPNSGGQINPVAITLGGAPLDFTAVNGFDIPAGVTVGKSNDPVTAGFGTAALTVGGMTGLYSINLVTGEAKLLGNVGTGMTGLAGLAVADVPAGSVSFDLATATVAEGGSVTLTLTRTSPNGTATVNVVVTGDTDMPQTLTATFLDGQTTTSVTFQAADDAVFEGGDKAVSLALASGTGGLVFGPQNTSTVTVTDNDAQPTVSVGSASVAEGNAGTTQLTFTVTLSNPSTAPVTVTVDTKDGSAVAGEDYTALAGQVVTVNPGATSAVVTVDVLGDLTAEADETFSVVLSGPTGATLAAGGDTAAGTITNDDAAVVSVGDVSVPEGNTGTTPAVFTLTLSNPSSTPVTVTVSTTDGTAASGTDFQPLTNQVVTFAPGQTSQTVTVNVIGDTAAEPNETFTLNLSNPNGVTLGRATGAATITDDDTTPPPAGSLSIGNATVTEGNVGTTPAVFTITLSTPSASPVTVTVSTTDGTAASGTDFQPLTNQVVTFAPGQTSQTVTVNVIGDTAAEPNETFTVTLSAPTGATLATATGTGTITDDDGTPPPTPTVSINNVTVTEGNSGTTKATFTVTLSSASSSPVTVTVNTASGTATAGTDFQALSNTVVTFAPGQTSQTVTVNVIGDTVDEPNETFTVTLSNPTGATLGTATGTGTITDDDAPVAKVGVPRNTAVGSTQGGQVVVFGPDGKQLSSFTAFPSAPGGVRVATGDVNGDGVDDVLVSTGPGVVGQVRLLDGKTQAELFSITPFDNFVGGVFVAMGDVTGDGVPDLAISAGERGGPRVRLFDGKSFAQINDFFGIEDVNFRGGARVAIGDVTGDGVGDLVVAAGEGGGPRIAVFDGTTLANARPSKPFGDFFVFEQTLRNGVFISAGDVTGDGKAEVIAGGGPGGGPRVFALDGAALLAGNQTQRANFFAGNTSSRTGVRVTVKDLDGDGKTDLVTGTEGANPVTAFTGSSIQPNGVPNTAFTADPFGGSLNGIFVG